MNNSHAFYLTPADEAIIEAHEDEEGFEFRDAEQEEANTEGDNE